MKLDPYHLTASYLTFCVSRDPLFTISPIELLERFCEEVVDLPASTVIATMYEQEEEHRLGRCQARACQAEARRKAARSLKDERQPVGSPKPEPQNESGADPRGPTPG